ncbi:MAG: transglycosylase SLT domain-containing protein [Acidimicrobiia bacterium]|nr:transglycosylase SLT domain-containing protein [Acidimicrobiia bacterium]
MASLAVAGFAAFTPEAPVTPAPVPDVVATTQPPLSVPATLGSVAGRVAAMNFATSNIYATGEVAPNVNRLIDERIAELETELAQTPPTTAPAPTPTTRPSAPPVTSPATTTPPTTAPPATTTTLPPEPGDDGAGSGYSVPAGYSQANFDAWVVGPWLGLVQTFFAPSDVERALQVIWCESRGDSGASNGSSGAAGLFQHLPRFWGERSVSAGWGGADIFDPTANTAVAAWLLYDGGGWKHWFPSAGCWG